MSINFAEGYFRNAWGGDLMYQEHDFRRNSEAAEIYGSENPVVEKIRYEDFDGVEGIPLKPIAERYREFLEDGSVDLETRFERSIRVAEEEFPQNKDARVLKDTLERLQS